MDLKQLHQLKCELLKVYRYQGLTLQELLCEFYSHINEVINSTNGLIDIVDYLVGEGLSNEVATHLNQMLIDGTFDKIISNKVDELSTNLNNQFNEMKKIIESNISESDKLIENLKIYDSRFNNIDIKNIEQDSRLKDVENKNKVQDIYIRGLFNENKDGRLSVEGEGNDLKLEGSKQGLVTVDKIVGNTFVNLYKNLTKTFHTNYIYGYNEKIDMSLFKPSTQYTTIVLGCERIYSTSICNRSATQSFYIRQLGSKCCFTTPSDFSVFTDDLTVYCYSTSSNLFVKGDEEKIKILILEGNYTNKPIPSDVIEGLQSSFESNLVTQEMVNEGLESEENLGKYKVPVRLIGKNKYNWEEHQMTDYTFGMHQSAYYGKNLKLKPNTQYVISSRPYTLPNGHWVVIYVKDLINGKLLEVINQCQTGTSTTNRRTTQMVTTDSMGYLGLSIYIESKKESHWNEIKNFKLQIEEVEYNQPQATDYEDYFERTANVYLNSPLLENDEIVMYNGELCHYHKRCRESYNGSDENWLTYNKKTNTNTFKIEIPKILAVRNSDFSCDKYTNADIVGSYDGEGICVYDNKFIYLGLLNTKANTVLECKQYLQSNPFLFEYQLAEPWYEPIQADKLLLECANDSTLHIESIVPVESVSASYKGNIPSVYAIEETGITNTDDIAVTQTAVDFLLMSNVGEVMVMSFTNNTKSGNNLGSYFTSRIIKKALSYEDVINKYPQFKKDIDTILVDEGYEYLIK